MKEPIDISFAELLSAIRSGTCHFAWLPTPVFHPFTYFRDGYTWLKPVRRLRRIGFPEYYYVRESDFMAALGDDDGRC